METYLTDVEQNLLRQRGIISSSEVAKRIGDLLIAEDVTTRTRRVIENAGVLAEVSPSRQVLKG